MFFSNFGGKKVWWFLKENGLDNGVHFNNRTSSRWGKDWNDEFDLQHGALRATTQAWRDSCVGSYLETGITTKNLQETSKLLLNWAIKLKFFATEFFIQKFGIKKSLGSKFAWVNLDF